MSCSCKIGGGPAGVCFECKSRRAFHARLKKLEDAKASADYARGVADERARVVKFLKAEVARSFTGSLRRQVVTALLLDIERGEHEREGA